MNIFDVRTLNADEQKAIKMVVDDTVEVMNQIKDLQDHMNENCKELADKLNENVDNDMKIKPTLFKKMAKAYIKNKEDIEKSKNELDEVEEGLNIIYKI